MKTYIMITIHADIDGRLHAYWAVGTSSAASRALCYQDTARLDVTHSKLCCHGCSMNHFSSLESKNTFNERRRMSLCEAT